MSTHMPITIPTGPPYSRIMAIGGYRPSRVVTNEEMCTMIDSTPEWIEQRTGITERRWVGAGENALTMAEEAATKALARAGLQVSSHPRSPSGHISSRRLRYLGGLCWFQLCTHDGRRVGARW